MEKILIIDDNKLICKTLKDILSKAGYKVVEAEDGETGLVLARVEHPDLIITDFQMPGIDGLEVLTEIRKLNIALPVILLTAFGDVVLTIKSIQLGAFDFLEKPIDPSQLKSTVQLALNSVRVSNSLNEVALQDMSVDGMLEDDILVGKTPKMKEIFKNIGRISLNHVNVLVQGDTGTGKELIAKLVHYSGITQDQPLMNVNCSALTETQLENELFGYVKGTFTGSDRDKKGKFELAGEGSVFLDEISEMSLNTQVKFLRVIQEQQFERNGGEETIPMKARILAATSRNLEELVKEGKFREDLYYQLKVFTIDLPPLRERKDDIRDLVVHFLTKLNKRFNRNVVKIGEGVIELLKTHDWYGNVRELENTILQAIIMSKSDVLEKEQITLNNVQKRVAEIKQQEAVPQFRSMADMEKFHIKRILDEVNWNKLEASHILDITRPTLNAKIEKYSLVRG